MRTAPPPHGRPIHTRRLRRAPRRSWLLAAIGICAATATDAVAVVSAGPSPIGAAAIVGRALRVAAMLPPASAARAALAPAQLACAAPADAGTGAPGLDTARCGAAIGALHEAVVGETDDVDPATRGLARVARIVLADALSRLTVEEPSGAATGGAPLPRGATRATVQVSGDGRTLRLVPERALRAGRAYELVLRGLPADVRAQWRAGAAGGSGALAAEVSAAYDAVLASERPPFDDDGVRALVGRLAASLDGVDDVPGASGARATLSRPLDARELAGLRASFVPASPTADPAAVVRFRTRDPRRGLVTARDRIGRLPCPGTRDAALEAADLGSLGNAVAGVYRGRYRTVDARAPQPGATERTRDHPFLLALPAGVSATTPVVLIVHGHGGRADVLLRSTAQDLARRGMATLAIDLAAHGARASEAQFADPLHPARLTRGIRDAAVDVLGVIDATTRCGLALPDGVRIQPPTVRYLGYSLGAAIGVLVRAVEPRLGTTVLVAPAADLAEWQVQQVAKKLGAETYTICSGGASHGAVCTAPTACGADGACVFDPRIVLLGDVLAMPFRLVYADADPLAFAVERTGGSTAPLLVMGGEVDLTAGPWTAARLADAYGMTLGGSSGARGATRRFVSWPSLGHELFGDPRVRAAAFDFLAHGGRRPAPATR